ncbi:MAG TPA: helical backbone metal receptor, partial [Thermoanaerobaculia bacterium]
GDAVVGATKFCIFPPTMAVTRIGGTKNPDVDIIRQLGPDLVYVNVEENLARHAEAIAEFAPVFATEPKSVSGVLQLLADLGAIHRREERAREIAIVIEEELPRDPEPFAFACAVWKEPWMWSGGDTYVSNLVAAMGGENVLRDHARYPVLDVLDIRRLRPDLVFLPDEPYEFTPDDAQHLRSAGLTVIGPFPGHLFTWHGSRTLAGLRFLRSALEQHAETVRQATHQ